MSQELTTAPQKTEPKTLTIRQQISDEYFKQQIAVALPKHMTPDRFVRVALTALMKTPKLLDCTKESVIECLLTCSSLGIEPDGRRAHLIPYGTKCTLIVDYKGIVELAKRSGDVSGVFAQIVCDKDSFQWENGEVKHQIDWRNERGPMYAVYATITFKDGTKQTDVMTKSEVTAIQRRSKAGTSGPWVTDFNEMAKKTVFRRASKWITLSPEIADALEKDGDNFSSLSPDTELNAAKPDFSVSSEPAAPTKRLGRPPKSAAMPPAVVDMPPEPPAEPVKPEASLNYVKGIRGLLKLAGAQEGDFMQWCHSARGWDDSLVNLDEVALVAPAKLEEVYENWPTVEKQFTAALEATK